MANCPKCERHLKLTDWKQKCPYCGANVFLYNLQERLMQDADKAEVQHFYFQKKVDRAKASYIGSRLAYVRIVTSLLPAAAVFLPLMLTEPGSAGLPKVLDAIKLYSFFSETDMGAFLELVKAEPAGKFFLAALVCLVLSLLFWLLHFALLFLSCSPRGKARNYTLDILQLGFALAYMLLILFLPAGAFAAVFPDVGTWLYLLLSAVNLIVDILVFRQGIEIKHKQCYVGGIPIEEYFEMQEKGVSPEEIRAEQYRRLTALQQEKERALEGKTGQANKKEAEQNG